VQPDHATRALHAIGRNLKPARQHGDDGEQYGTHYGD
jgi:hypothetical protein